MPAAIAVENSDNAKLGRCSATYASQESCPASCKLRGAGCYAEHGPLGYVTARVNNSGYTSPETIALQEAQAIDKLSGYRLLRLHVVGDCATDRAARTVAAACARYHDRGIRPSGGRKKVWTYTHAWRAVKRSSWGRVAISVLASCETPQEALLASAKGYAAALLVSQFESEAGYRLENGLKVLPCPWQTSRITCEQCRLCLDDNRLREAGIVIGFEPHGAGANTVRRNLFPLEVLQ